MGNISKDTRGAARKDLPTKEKGNGSYGTDMDATNGKMGNAKKKRRHRTCA